MHQSATTLKKKKTNPQTDEELDVLMAGTKCSRQNPGALAGNHVDALFSHETHTNTVLPNGYDFLALPKLLNMIWSWYILRTGGSLCRVSGAAPDRVLWRGGSVQSV